MENKSYIANKVIHIFQAHGKLELRKSLEINRYSSFHILDWKTGDQSRKAQVIDSKH